MAICDDEASALEHTRLLAQAWAEQAGHAARIETFLTAEAFLIQYEEDKAFDLLLLDIEMARMNGVALARTVRAQNREIAIVFLTGYADYIADGYDVEALHYLLKPITREKLSRAGSRGGAPPPQRARAAHRQPGRNRAHSPL